MSSYSSELFYFFKASCEDMNSEEASIAPINLKVKSYESNLEKEETTFAKRDIATHLKEMEQVLIWLIGHSMYVFQILHCTCYVL